MKKNETREETLARLARDARRGASAAKRFKTLVRRVAQNTNASGKDESKQVILPPCHSPKIDRKRGQTSILLPLHRIKSGRTSH